MQHSWDNTYTLVRQEHVESHWKKCETMRLVSKGHRLLVLDGTFISGVPPFLDVPTTHPFTGRWQFNIRITGLIVA